MHTFILTFVLAFCATHAAAKTSNVSPAGVALEGYDPVSYFRPDAAKLGPLKGDPKISIQHDEATYYFSTEANRQEFQKNPVKYSPAYGGWCAYAVAAKKEKVSVDVKSFLVQNDRLLLFYNGFLADTRDKWQNTKSKPAAQYLKDADLNWPDVKNKEP